MACGDPPCCASHSVPVLGPVTVPFEAPRGLDDRDVERIAQRIADLMRGDRDTSPVQGNSPRRGDIANLRRAFDRAVWSDERSSIVRAIDLVTAWANENGVEV